MTHREAGSPTDRDRFLQRGFAGPYRCDAPLPADLVQRVWQGRAAKGPGSDTPGDITDPHQDSVLVREVIEHPSVLTRVAALLGDGDLRYFQSRLRVRSGHSADPVVWHQDVGPRNGGCFPDGRPVPTLTMWLSLDGAGPESGCLLALPETHGEPLGNWRDGYRADIEGTGALAPFDLGRAVPLVTEPGEFYLLHSWVVHTASPNSSPDARTALVARFVRPENAIDPGITYYRCQASSRTP